MTHGFSQLRADDARMFEVLERCRGQRGRVQRLFEVSGLQAPRAGARPPKQHEMAGKLNPSDQHQGLPRRRPRKVQGRPAPSVGSAWYRADRPTASIFSNPPTWAAWLRGGMHDTEDTMAKTPFGSREPARTTLRRRSALLPFVVLGLSLTFAGTTFAAAGTFTVVNHFSTVMHFDPSPECGDFGGSTDYATGTEHFHITDLGDSVAVSYSETFWITTVPDRPSESTYRQQGTDALTFHLLKDGSQIFHESFHQNGATFDNGATYLMIRFYTTFVYVNGTVLVDHTFGANLPGDC